MKISEYLKENTNRMFVTESIRSRDIDKALRLMKSCLSNKNIYLINNIMPLHKDNKASFGILAWTEKNTGVCFVWSRDDSTRIDSLLFTNHFDKACVAWVNNDSKFIWDVAVDCKGANLVKITYLADKILNGKLAMTSAAINADLKDAQLFENEEETINPMGLIVEKSDDPIIIQMEKQKQALYMKIRSWSRKGKPIEGLQQQYDELKQKLTATKLAVRNNVPTQLETDNDIETLNKYFEEEKALSEERFGDAESYIDLVRGIAPKIKPDILAPEAKERALDYLQELADKKVPMEISIRSFTLCAGLFMSDAPERAIQRRIKEQISLQSARGDKKY